MEVVQVDMLKYIAAIAIILSPFALVGWQMWKQWKLSKAQKERHQREIDQFRNAAAQILEAERQKVERRNRERAQRSDS